jgi:hypothetical protein
MTAQAESHPRPATKFAPPFKRQIHGTDLALVRS